MAESDVDVYQDLDLVAGTDFIQAFSLQPLDLSGCTARRVIDGLGTFAFTLSVAVLGQAPISYFKFKVLAAVTVGWAPGLYPYRDYVTFADGSQLPYGHGELNVT